VVKNKIFIFYLLRVIIVEMTFDLNTIWFFLLTFLFTGYAVLDGFDLGVGAIHLFAAKSDRERRISLNAIGPVWDGNEVWLVTAGGALFAAFPHVYATVFSGFYFAMILLLFMLIFRAVAIEFRSKKEIEWWRKMWDIAFSISSMLIAFLLGVALGNIITGIPLGPDKEFQGSFFSLLNPYAVLTGIIAVIHFMLHGSIYLAMKTENDMQKKIKSLIKKIYIIFISLYLVITLTTIFYVPHMVQPFKDLPLLLLIPILHIFFIIYILRESRSERHGRSFICSSASIILFMILIAIGIYPNLVISNPNPGLSLTIYNAASSQKTLWIMLIIVLTGFPLVITYTVIIYRVFRGKVKLDKMSY
jgi:cytochrome d ubiquinol oxidase subunit II